MLGFGVFLLLYQLIFSSKLPGASGEVSEMAEACEKSPSMALIPYEPPVIFRSFREDERSFEFCGQSIKLHQSWEQSGVAAVVWDAAVVLGRYLETIAKRIRRKRVIELGAGTGLAGIVATLLGARVTITDREEALAITRKNVEDNLGQEHPLVKVRALDWGQDVDMFAPPYDLILGADVVYIEETFGLLLKSLRDLADYDTVVLLACKIRYDRDHKFLKMFNEEFDSHEVFYSKESDIHIYEARLRNS